MIGLQVVAHVVGIQRRGDIGSQLREGIHAHLLWNTGLSSPEPCPAGIGRERYALWAPSYSSVGDCRGLGRRLPPSTMRYS